MIQTPFEATGDLTTVEDEATFWTDLAADSPRVRVEQVGTTVGGRPVRLVGIGYPAAPPDPGTAAMPSMLVTGYQHGHEAAGREAAIQLARDLAYTTDPDELAYLNKRPVWIMPSINLDRAPLDIRENLNGVNLNRDHVRVNEPETQAVHHVLGLLRPHLTVDLHEGVGPSWDAGIGCSNTPAIHAGIFALAEAGMHATVNQLTQWGMRATTWAHDRSEGMMHNAAGLRGTVGFLVETNMTGEQEMPQRIDAHLASLRALRQFHTDNAAALAQSAVQAREDKAAEGLAGTVPFSLTSTLTLDPPPRGYRLTQAHRDAIATTLTLDGIYAEQDGDHWIVPMGQWAQPAIPFLMDPDSLWWPKAGSTRITDPAEPLPVWTPPDPLPEYVPEPMPPAPGGQGLYLTDGRPVTLMRTDGTPAMA